MTEQKFRHALLDHLNNLEPRQFSYDVRRTAHALLDASAELDRKICADATPVAEPAKYSRNLSDTQCKDLSPEDRASMFIDWCALSGHDQWPPGAYRQLVAHLRAMQSADPVVAKSATTADLASDELHRAMTAFVNTVGDGILPPRFGLGIASAFRAIMSGRSTETAPKQSPASEGPKPTVTSEGIEGLISRYQDINSAIWVDESEGIDRAIRDLATEAAAISRAETLAQLRVVSQEARDQGCVAICDTDGQRNSLRVGTIYHVMINAAVKGLK